MKRYFTASPAGIAFAFAFALAAIVLSFPGVSHAAAKKIECGVRSGKVMHMPASGAEWTECSGTFEVKTGGKIKLDAAGEALVQYSDGTMVTLRPETELEIKADGIRLNEAEFGSSSSKPNPASRWIRPPSPSARAELFSASLKSRRKLS